MSAIDELWQRPQRDRRQFISDKIGSSWMAAPDAGLTEREIAEKAANALKYTARHDRAFGADFLTDRQGNIISRALARRIGFDIADSDVPGDMGDIGNPDTGRSNRRPFTDETGAD